MDSTDSDAVVTLINVFRVDPVDQHALAERVLTTARELAASLPGFLDATVLISTDGQRVANYAHWRDDEALAQFLARAKDELRLAVALGQPDGHTYSVAGRVVAPGPA